MGHCRVLSKNECLHCVTDRPQGMKIRDSPFILFRAYERDMCIWNSMTLSTEAFMTLLCKYRILNTKQNIVQNNIDNNTPPTPTRTHTLTQPHPHEPAALKNGHQKSFVEWNGFTCLVPFTLNALPFFTLIVLGSVLCVEEGRS